MKKTLLLAGIASLVAFNASATEYLPYVAARFARVEVKNDAYQYTIFEGNNTRYDVVNDKINDDQFGYRFAAGVMVPLCGGLAESVRAELEYGLINKTHNNGNWSMWNIASTWEMQSKIQTLFANFYYDLNTDTAVTPYFGFGLGYARINEKAGVSIPVPGMNAPVTEKAKGSEDNFAWNVGVGVSVNLTYNIDVEVGYRYTDYGKMVNHAAADYAKRNYTSQEVLLGLRYTF